MVILEKFASAIYKIFALAAVVSQSNTTIHTKACIEFSNTSICSPPRILDLTTPREITNFEKIQGSNTFTRIKDTLFVESSEEATRIYRKLDDREVTLAATYEFYSINNPDSELALMYQKVFTNSEENHDISFAEPRANTRICAAEIWETLKESKEIKQKLCDTVEYFQKECEAEGFGAVPVMKV